MNASTRSYSEEGGTSLDKEGAGAGGGAVEGMSCQWDTSMVSLICCYFLILLVGTFGNALVLAMFKKKGKHSVLNLLIMYLAAFDLFASLFVPFLFGYWLLTCDQKWHFGLFGCKTLPVATRVFTSVSIGILLIMAIERCRVIISPFKSPMSRKTVHCLVIATVFLSVLSETHYIATLNIDEGGQCAALGEPYYLYASIVVTLMRTMAFISIFLSTTLLVTCKLHQKSFFDGDGESPSQILASQSMVRTRRRKRATKMLVVMMVVFGVTVLPRDLFQMSISISYLLPKLYWIEYSPTLLKINTILKILQTTNSIYNVFIYAGMYKGFVENAWKICKCVKQYTIRRQTVQRRRLANEQNITDDRDKYHLRVTSKNTRLTVYSQTSPDKVSADDAWI